MENTYKYYIRINESRSITDVFSDAFKKPLETDICIKENADRHVNLEETFPLGIKDVLGYVYEYVLVKSNPKTFGIRERDRHSESIQALKIKKLETIKRLCATTIDNATVSFKNELFGCSMTNQHNWIALLTSNSAGMLTYPLNVFSIGGKSVEIISENELKEVTGKIFSVVYTAREVCNSKQVLIENANTVEEIEAI